jgi:hypothetical protein
MYESEIDTGISRSQSTNEERALTVKLQRTSPVLPTAVALAALLVALPLRTTVRAEQTPATTPQNQPSPPAQTAPSVQTALGQASGGQQIPALPMPRPGFSFPQKQTLTYSVDWRVFPAATAVMHLEANGPNEHLTATADTIGAINLLFHISDRFQSTFDREKGCTTEFDKQTVEGRRQITSTMKLDYAHGKAVLDEKNLTAGTSKHLESAIPACLTDLLTGVFYASSQNFAVGKSFEIPIVDPVKTVVVTMKAEGREELKTAIGTFKTIRVQPTAEAGIVKNRGQIWIWYSEDERHLPVQIRARSFWGTITLRVASIESK